VAPEIQLPAPITAILHEWRGLKKAGELPPLALLAPARIPPELVPWLMTYRRRPDQGLTYGVVGGGLRTLFRENPSGKPFLHYASAEVRQARSAIVHQALDTGRPYWFLGNVLFEDVAVEFGRLGLPTSVAEGETLLLIYYALGSLPEFPAKPGAGPEAVEPKVTWLDE
jgi:hypothetical protein